MDEKPLMKENLMDGRKGDEGKVDGGHTDGRKKLLLNYDATYWMFWNFFWNFFL